MMDVDGAKTTQSNGHSNHIEDKESNSEGHIIDMPKSKRNTRTATAAAASSPLTPEKLGKKRSSSPSHQQPRSSKRQRLQYQPFQSPGLGNISIGKGSKAPEDKVVIFYKGEFLALRNENGSFFVCQAAQNVYKSSRKFKIRWLSRTDSKEDDLYTPDFYDFTDFECVLTNLQMERRDKNVFRLPKSETVRTENILRRALNLENGIHEPELDQVEPDGVQCVLHKFYFAFVLFLTGLAAVDVSMVNDGSPTPKRIRMENSIKPVNSPKPSTSFDGGRPTRRQIKQNSNSNINNNQLRVLRSATITPKRKKKAITSKVKMKSSPVRLRPRIIKEEPKDLTPKKDAKIDRHGRGKSSPQEKLKPNNRVTVLNKDPTFESNTNIPVVSVSAYSKLPIRAVLTRDMRLLQSLIADSANVCSVTMVRSVDQQLDALVYALIQENHKAIQLILKEILNPTKKRVKVPDSFLIQQTTGKLTTQFLGHSVRDITISRGSREGNNALNKDENVTLNEDDYIGHALEHGISKSTLETYSNFLCQDKNRTRRLKDSAITNFHKAVRFGHRKLAGQLVEDALKLDGFGFNSLHKEVLLYDKQELPSCRAASVKKRAFTIGGLTPIHCAAVNPNPKYLSTLLAIDPEYNIPDRNMRRPIHYAVVCEGTGPLDFLLSKGVRTDETDNDGNTVLHIAADTGRIHNVELLLKRAKSERKAIDNNANKDFGLAGLNRTNKQSLTPLHVACLSGHSDVVRILLKYGADVDRPTNATKGKLTPLMFSCQKGYLEILKILIQNGAKVETRDKFKRTALTHAIINGHAHIASHLLRLGSDPNNTDSSGNTLIHYAAAYGWWFCLKLLLESGAKPNVSNDWMLTPLGVAFLKGHMGLVDLLLEQPGVDINFKDEKGVSLLMLAASSPLTPDLVEQVQYLLEGQKADCLMTDPQGNTVFHWLARNTVRRNDRGDSEVCPEAVSASLEIAKLLLEYGCDPSVRNERGETALTLAIEQGNNQLVKLLLRDGCQVTAEVDDTGENLLHNLVEHAWETDLASLIHIIKDSDPGKKPKKTVNEEVVELNLAKPVLPLLQSLNGGLKIADSINIKGVCESSSEGFTLVLLKGENVEKDDAIVQLGVQLKEGHTKLSITKTSRVDGEWSQEELDEAVCSTTDGQATFELSICAQKDLIQVCVGENVIIEFTPAVSIDQISHLHIGGKVNVEWVNLKRASNTSKVQLTTVSLPVEVLLEMAQTYSYDGFTPLLLACSKYLHATEKKQQTRLRDMIKALIEEADSEIHAVVKKRSDDKARPIDGYSALHFLASAKEVSGVVNGVESPVPTLQLVLNYKPLLNIRDNRGRTPLITAILSGQAAAAEALISAGADVNLFSEDEEDDGRASPIVLAAKLGLVSIIKLLVKHQVDVTTTDQKNQNTPLHYAVCLKTAPEALEVVQLLVQAGVKINSTNKDGRTPLHLAVNVCTGSTDDSVEIEDYLIENGVDVFAKDNLGRLPLHYAFVKIGKNSDSSKIDPIEIVSLLTCAMKESNIDCPDGSGQTPLHCAAFRGSTISCMHLAQRMSNLDSKDSNGNTALSLTILGGHESCAIMLLQRGASIKGDVVVPPPELKSSKKPKRPAWQWKPLAKPPLSAVKSPILEEVAAKDWQGVMYMMLDQLQTSSHNYFPAVEAALSTNKFRLALSLIARIKDSTKLRASDSQNLNLLHLLAYKADPDEQTVLQIRVAEALIQRGLSLTECDKFGSYPITYAAVNKNMTLCEYFTEKMGIETLKKLPADKLGRTPLTALFWWTDKGNWKEKSSVRRWCQRIVQSGMLDVLAQFPAPLIHPGQVVLQNSKNPNITETQEWRLSPLIHATCCGDQDLVRLLLQYGVDVNLPDNFGFSPLMHAIRMNNIQMVKLLLNHNYTGEEKIDKGDTPELKSNRLLTFRDGLVLKNKSLVSRADGSSDEDEEEMTQDPLMEIEEKMKAMEDNKQKSEDSFKKTSNADLKYKDKDGSTIIHKVVQPYDGASYENVQLLQLFVELDSPLDQPNEAGLKPLDMAESNRFTRIAAAIQKLSSDDKPLHFLPISNLDVDDGVTIRDSNWNYKDDSAALVEKMEVECMEEAEEDSLNKPDPQTGMEDTGEIVSDQEQGILYDALMTKVDLNYGVWGRYNYYKLQIICQKGKDLYILFTRWGRIGTVGQFQQTPFRNLDDAVKEFCKVFRSKTGNAWQDVKKFVPHVKKYHLVTFEQQRRRRLRDIAINLECELPSQLPSSLQELMKDLTNVTMLQEACRDAGIDVGIMPFGRLSESAINKGRNILGELKELVTTKNKLEDDAESREKLTEICEKIIVMSNRYYQAIPQFGYAYERVQPLDSINSLQTCCDQVDNLAELEVCSQLLLGAQFRTTEMNPLDYIYRAINCKLSLMSEAEMESQYILQYINNTTEEKRVVVESIHRVCRFDEKEVGRDVGNRWLFWHGTSSANLVSILARGLQCGHPSTPTTAPQFNRGIYFADMFEKSRHFVQNCHNNDNRSHYILLCEVALGKVHKNLEGDDVDGPYEDFDSTKIVGTYFPDPTYNLSLSSGITIPLGAQTTKLNKKKDTIYRSTNYNEFIVFNRQQVRLRYVVCYRYDSEKWPEKSKQVSSRS
uniref:Poly [ADP-ribose] polymerase n=1 Tax=Strigamia maritima TaxID=126957 RepID=T1IYM8_STRMM